MNKFVQKTFLLLILGLSICGCKIDANANAQGVIKWQETKAHLQGNVSCENMWDLIWPYAKEGNPEALNFLFSLTASAPHVPRLILPGSSGDLASDLRHLLILAVHTETFRSTLESDKYLDFSQSLYKRFGFEDSSRGREFLKCIDEKEKNCVQIAVTESLVPSFKNYTAEIDLFLNNNMGAHCIEN